MSAPSPVIQTDPVITPLAGRFEASESGAVVVLGEPGTGKTTVLRAASVAAEGRGWHVVRLGCTAAEGAVAWSGLAALIGEFPATLRASLHDDHRSALAIACGDRGPTDGIGALAVAPLVAGALRHLLRESAALAPTLVVVDDLQWADSATAAAIAAALRPLSDEPVGVLAAMRPVDDVALDLPRLFAERCVVVHPARLDRTEIMAMLRGRGVAATVPMLDDIERLGAGNALHTLLLIDQIAAAGWQPGRLPASIAASHRRRFDALDHSTRTVLAHAALLGTADGRTLGAALPGTDVDAALLAAERAGMVDGDLFTHATIPASIAETIGTRERAAMHRALGAALAEDHELRPVQLAAAADGADGALADLLDRSAQRALDRGARHLAGERFLRAAELSAEQEPGEQWRRTLAAADAFVGAGAIEAALVHSRTAFDLAGDPMQRAMAGGVHTQALAGLGDMVATRRFAVDLLDELVGWPMLRAFLGRALVRIEQTIDLHAALDTAEAMRAEMEAAGLASFVVEFELAAANCRYVLGEPVDPRAVWRIGAEVFDANDFISAGWMALEVLVWSCVDADTSWRALEQVETAARATGSLQSVAKVHDFRGNHLVRAGRWPEGETELRRAMDLAELTGSTTNMSPVGLAWVLAATGRTEEARHVLERARVAVPSEETPLFLAANEAATGFVELCEGRWENAVQSLSRAWDAADKFGMDDVTGLPFRVELVEALLMCGRLDDAAARTDRLVRMAERSANATALAQAERARALMAAAHNDADGALAAAGRAAVHLRSFDVPIEQARMQLAVGSALRRAGRRKEAAAALRDAAGVFTLLGAEPYLRRCEDELDRLGASRSTSDDLTPTEAQIARLVADGASNTEVATRLIISPRTVEANLTRIYRKLSIRSRSQLAAAYRGR